MVARLAGRLVDPATNADHSTHRAIGLTSTGAVSTWGSRVTLVIAVPSAVGTVDRSGSCGRREGTFGAGVRAVA
ncbi:MAG: hypothetical protein ACRDRS_07630 [Pseudonocardiaceae bacterium]